MLPLKYNHVIPVDGLDETMLVTFEECVYLETGDRVPATIHILRKVLVQESGLDLIQGIFGSYCRDEGTPVTMDAVLLGVPGQDYVLSITWNAKTRKAVVIYSKDGEIKRSDMFINTVGDKADAIIHELSAFLHCQDANFGDVTLAGLKKAIFTAERFNLSIRWDITTDVLYSWDGNSDAAWHDSIQALIDHTFDQSYNQ